MKLIAELSTEQYEDVAVGEGCSLFHGHVEEVEIRQGDGLLNTTRRVQRVELISSHVAQQLGLDLKASPAIRVYVAQEEDQDG